MADKLLSTVLGSGGGSFVPYSSLQSLTVAAGASGDIYDITPGAGNTLRVLRLSTGTTTAEAGMTVTITNNSGTQDLLTNSSLEDFSPTGGAFYIGEYQGAISLNQTADGIDYVDCKRIVVTKVTGNTVEAINISYIEGRFES